MELKFKKLRHKRLIVKWVVQKEWENFRRAWRVWQEEFHPGLGMEFKLGPNGIVPMEPWPMRFYVSRALIKENLYEVRPLTLWGVLAGILACDVAWTWWRWIAVFYFFGFLDPPPNEIVGLCH